MKRIFFSAVQILGYLLGVLLIARMIILPFKTILGPIEEVPAALSLLVIGFAMTAGLVCMHLVFLRIQNGDAIRAGWPAPDKAFSGFMAGNLIGLAMAGSMFLLLIVTGSGTLELQGFAWAPYLKTLIPLGLGLLLMALSEEWVFRGYLLTRVAGIIGALWAILLLSLLFALFHAGNTGWNGLIALNIFWGAFVAGTLRFSKGGIPAAWGFHFAWNGLQAASGSTISGESFEIPGIRFQTSGSELWSGGDFGPEGSICALLSTLLTLLLLFVLRRKLDIRLFGNKKDEGSLISQS